MRTICAALLVTAGPLAYAKSLTVNVEDRDALPVPDVVVYATPLDRAAPPPVSDAVATVNQVNQRFVPHILTVRTGTQIEFPNNDTVRHHVYSFSEAKRFELPLYAGSAHSPIRFDAPGVVVIGCNIHDDMLGYIVVLDTPYVMTTDASGTASLDGLPAGEYRVEIWTPRTRADRMPPPLRITTDGSSARQLRFAFDSKLYPPHDPEGGSLTWHSY